MSRDSEDKETPESQSKPENPFIKFRQFADEQISSILQGIIGLPSALSKTQGNARWADFDDELRRRDELQARQKELRESEARKTSQAAAQSVNLKSDSEIPVKRFTDWAGPPLKSSEQPADNQEMDDKVARDLPLYAPVTKSLFAHLKTDGESDWNPLHWPPGVHGIIPDPPIGFNPKARLRACQYHLFDILNTLPEYRSSYSLLPYLLFSPYSPLKLSLESVPSKSHHDSPTDDCFPYREAFEDLIMVSHGRPMATRRWLDSFHGLEQQPPGHTWVHQLHRAGILQQKEARTEQAQDNGSILRQASFLRSGKVDGKSDTPRTEEEMYERFLRLVSPDAASPSETIVESLFADIEKELKGLNKELKDFKPENDIERAIKWIIEEFTNVNPEGRTPRVFTDDFIKDLLPSLRQDLKDSAERMQSNENSKAVFSPDKIVSTTTTSEHTTNEDGSIETSVTVWKRYADGRETVTTTTHTEDPARDRNGNPTETLPAAPTAANDDREKDDGQENEKETGKKGWFWN